MSRMYITLLSLLFLAIPALPGFAGQKIAGPVAASLLRVIDGDTLLVEAMPWPQHRIVTYVRLRGIDAAELKSPCENLRQKAEEARDTLGRFMPENGELQLTDISGDKFYGRIVAAVYLRDGRNLSDMMLSRGLAVQYGGGRKARPDC